VWPELSSTERLEKLDRILMTGRTAEGDRELAPFTEEVNNHVHTCYSFSPYTPSEVILKAREAGLRAVGIMDHDSVSGAREFTDAGRRAKVATTAGFELRVNADGTAIEGRKINNPDTKNIFYMAVHGIPANRLPAADRFLQPIRKRRNLRNRSQVAKLGEILRAVDLPELSYDRDVVPISMSGEGGSVTERHILYALALLLEKKWGRGKGLLLKMKEAFGIEPGPKVRSYLEDPDNPHYLYDLLGPLKSTLLPRFYIDPDKEECINVREAVEFAVSIGAVPAYAYLGDVVDSPTGDKKAERFEDGYLDQLIPAMVDMGFRAVTYMPPRNTPAQLERIMRLCSQYGLMQISGVDINSSRQSFHCSEIMDPRFSHLIDATWALIAHESLSDKDPQAGLFSAAALSSGGSLEERIRTYAGIGRSMYSRCTKRRHNE